MYMYKCMPSNSTLIPTMEMHTPFFLPLSITFFLFLLLVIKIRRNNSKKQNPKLGLPPGPWKLPIIDSIHHLRSEQIHHKLRDLATKHGPIMHLKLGELDHMVISSPEAAREVCKTQDLKFASRPESVASNIVLYKGKDIVFAPYGDYWRQLRKLCTVELLSVRRVKSFSYLMEQEISNVVKEISLADNSPVNLTGMFMSFANSITSRATTSQKDSIHRQNFLSALEEAIRLGSGLSIADLFPSFRFIDAVIGVKRSLMTSHQKIDQLMGEIINEHQVKRETGNSMEDESRVEDLVDVLLRVKDSDLLKIPLTMDNIKGVILDMFLGGSETASTILTWTMAELIKNPKVMEKAQVEVRQILKGKTKIQESDMIELQYLKLIVKETLRLHPPIPLLMRLCGETCEVGGFKIPSGTRIIINSWAMGRDPRLWDDAETFWPERFDGSSVNFKGANFEYLPFGAGRRICPGIAFGLATVELALASLLYYFDWKLPRGMKPEELDMTESFGSAVSKKHDLQLLAIPPKDSSIGSSSGEKKSSST